MEDYGVVTAADTVRIERLLPGPIERVWQYLVDPQKRGLWLASGDAMQRSGDSVELVFHNSQLSRSDDPAPKKYACGGEAHMRSRVIICEPPRRLSLSWGSPSGEDSEVCFELSEQAGKVLLLVTHRRLCERGEMISVAAGWHTHLDILAALLNGIQPESFWETHTRLESEYQKLIPTE